MGGGSQQSCGHVSSAFYLTFLAQSLAPECTLTVQEVLGNQQFLIRLIPPKPLNPYLDPKEPTFLGFLVMNSLYKSVKR